MLTVHPSIPFMLDFTTLFVVAICVTGLLGLLLLFAWTQDRVRALAWWGTAYLVGGVSVVIWSIESHISPPLPPGTANAMLFVACGMIWSAARLFHGRQVLWGAMAAGATIWLAACLIPDFVASAYARIVLSSFIVATYTFLTAAELWRERRKHLHAALAGDFRADAARAGVPVPDSARQRIAGRQRHRRARQRLDRRLHARGHALHRRHRLHRAGAVEGALGPYPQGCRVDRRADRRAEPARLHGRGARC